MHSKKIILISVIILAIHTPGKSMRPLYAASGSSSGTLRIWDLSHKKGTKKKCIKALKKHPHSIICNIRFHPKDENIILTKMQPKYQSRRESFTTELWDLSKDEGSEHIATLHIGYHKESLHPTNKNIIAAPTAQNTFSIWSITKQGEKTLLKTVHGHKRTVSCLVFHPTENIIASASADGTIMFCKTTDGTWTDTACIKNLKMRRVHICEILFNHHTPHLITVITIEGAIEIWNWYTKKQICSLHEHRGLINKLLYHPSNQHIAVSSSLDNTIKIWRTNNSTWNDTHCIKTFYSGTNTSCLAFIDPTDQNLLASNCSDSIVHTWDISHPNGMEMIDTFYIHADHTTALAFSQCVDTTTKHEQQDENERYLFLQKTMTHTTNIRMPRKNLIALTALFDSKQ